MESLLILCGNGNLARAPDDGRTGTRWPRVSWDEVHSAMMEVYRLTRAPMMQWETVVSLRHIGTAERALCGGFGQEHKKTPIAEGIVG